MARETSPRAQLTYAADCDHKNGVQWEPGVGALPGRPGMERRYQAVVRLARVLCRAFFREVEVVGIENVPHDRGGVLGMVAAP